MRQGTKFRTVSSVGHEYGATVANLVPLKGALTFWAPCAINHSIVSVRESKSRLQEALLVSRHPTSVKFELKLVSVECLNL